MSATKRTCSTSASGSGGRALSFGGDGVDDQPADHFDESRNPHGQSIQQSRAQPGFRDRTLFRVVDLGAEAGPGGERHRLAAYQSGRGLSEPSAHVLNASTPIAAAPSATPAAA